MKHLAEVLGGLRLSGAMIPDPEIELDEDEAATWGLNKSHDKLLAGVVLIG